MSDEAGGPEYEGWRYSRFRCNEKEEAREEMRNEDSLDDQCGQRKNRWIDIVQIDILHQLGLRDPRPNQLMRFRDNEGSGFAEPC